MIISHRHKMIFLHCRKVAGSSITVLLNRFLGPDDIQLGSWPESVRAGGRYNRWALWTLLTEPRALKHIAVVSGRSLAAGRRPKLHGTLNGALKQPFLDRLSRNPPHATAKLVRAFDPEAWASYRKYCFVRNPFEHAVSDYFWRKAPEQQVSFAEFLRRKRDPARPDPEHLIATPSTNWPIYTIDDEVAVDFVGRYERLAEDVRTMFSEIGLDPEMAVLPGAKSHTRKRSFREMYDDETRGLVEEVHAKELARFGYSFSDLA